MKVRREVYNSLTMGTGSFCLLTLKLFVCLLDVDVVIKAQILAGGRGLGKFKNGFKGGVHVCTR
jgi:hypothetical protein